MGHVVQHHFGQICNGRDSGQIYRQRSEWNFEDLGPGRSDPSKIDGMGRTQQDRHL
jgi:hypothetical protein